MSGKVIIVAVAAIATVGAGTAGVVMNSKKIKLRRAAQKTSNMLYTAGTILRALSCQMNES